MADAPQFEVLDISLVLGAGEPGGPRQKLWLTADSSQGSVRAVPVPKPDLARILGGKARPVDWLDSSIRASQADRELGLALGRALSATVFGPQVVRELFDRARGVAAANGRPLLLRVLGAPNEIAEWPWELMTDPMDRDLPIALSRDLHLIRTPRVRTYPLRSAPIPPPLNLLVVLSSPLAAADESIQMDPFDLYEAKRHLMAELRPLIAAGLLEVEVEDRPTIVSLRRLIGRRRQGFHAVHYLGHANRRGLALETASGRTSLVSSAHFSAILQHNPDLRLVVFSGCRTAQAPTGEKRDPWDWEGELSIAHLAVRDAASAVIGMQAVLPFNTERSFTRSFYSAITAGHSIAQSLKLARAALWDGPEGRSELLDWSVPTLYCGGGDPGPILDPSAPAVPVELPRRVSLRISPVQKELRFVSRYAQLREAIDILAGRNSTRLLCVQGTNGIRPEDLSSFIDRAMEELDPSIAHLSFSARDLAAGADGRDGADARITRFLKEIMRQYGVDDFEPVASDLDWPVLLEHLAEVPIAIGIDHTDDLPEDSPVFERIRSIVQRRGKVRVVVVNSRGSNRFNEGLGDALSLTLPLKPLTWPEVWQWVRGQLPRLAQLGEARLSPQYQVLGDRLDQWELFADRAESTSFAPSEEQLEQYADALRRGGDGTAPVETPLFSADGVPDRAPGGPAARDPEGAESAPAPAAEASSPEAPPLEPAEARQGQSAYMPVRIAIAGPYTAGRDAEIVRSMGRFASEYGIAGRVSGGDGADNAAIVAQSLPSGSPFDGKGQSTTAEMLNWFNRIFEAGVDIFVCDFGTDKEQIVLREVLQAISAKGMLLIAAGGNTGKPTWPAWYDHVLAVGALDENGQPKPYSPFFPEAKKPDIYAAASLAGSPIESWVKDPQHEGTSFSAMAVAADAALVWATYRKLTGPQVAQILRDTGTPIDPPAGAPPPADGEGPRRVNLEAAINAVHELMIKDILELGPASFNRLAAQSGLPSGLAVAAVKRLEENRIISRVTHSGQEIYIYSGRISSTFDGLWERGLNEDFGEATDRLFAQARALAARQRWSRADTEALWAETSERGTRFLALANMRENPDARQAHLLLAAMARTSLREPRYAMETLLEMVPEMRNDAEGKAKLAEQIELLDRFDPAKQKVEAELRERLLKLLKPAPGAP